MNDQEIQIQNISELFRELLGVLKVNILRGTILVKGADSSLLTGVLDRFEERLEEFNPPKSVGKIFVDPNIDWADLKF